MSVLKPPSPRGTQASEADPAARSAWGWTQRALDLVAPCVWSRSEPTVPPSPPSGRACEHETPIAIFTTGGTIDKAYFDALSDYRIGESQVARILQVAGVTLPFTVTELLRKDSLDLDDADRALIRHSVVWADSTRMVITHGTDTMTRTAEALAGIPDKTVVLVGALTPARFADSDAAFNLGMAFAAAQVAPPGIYLTMNGTVFAAARVEKDRRLGAFVSKGNAAVESIEEEGLDSR